MVLRHRASHAPSFWFGFRGFEAAAGVFNSSTRSLLLLMAVHALGGYHFSERNPKTQIAKISAVRALLGFVLNIFIPRRVALACCAPPFDPSCKRRSSESIRPLSGYFGLFRLSRVIHLFSVRHSKHRQPTLTLAAFNHRLLVVFGTLPYPCYCRHSQKP